jgi:acetyltransferase-like isoleucine patch superfamily enzyme
MHHSTAVVAHDVNADDLDVGSFAVVGVDGPPESLLRIGGGVLIRSHAVVYRGSTIGARVHIGHGALIRELSDIGDNVSIGSYSEVGHHVRLGRGVRLHSSTFVPEYSVIEEGAWVGPRVILTNARFPNRPDTKQRLEPVRIGAGAVIGAGALLLPGVHVGAGALVGAGAVVVRDVISGTTVVGNPARVVRRDENLGHTDGDQG